MNRICCLWAALIPLVFGSTARAQGHVAAQPAEDHSVDAAAEELLSRPISITLDHVSLRQALDSVAVVGRVEIEYRASVLAAQRTPVTLHAERMPLGTAFEQLLHGTGLRLVPLKNGLFGVTPERANAAQATGGVAGTVMDATTHKPLADAMVVVDSGRAVRTGENGAFVLPGISAGPHQVIARLIGYRVSSTPVTIRDGVIERLAILLTPSAATLSEVVTTGSGDRKRYEVGNAVATINADSVVQNAPLRNLSDLLNGRVPGMDVQSQSGEVGTGSRIRIRGLSSLVTNEDPIVIVDGVRVDAAFSSSPFTTQQGAPPPAANQASASSFLNVPASSRLNDIDINSIESIDVLRGPAASTLYGSDAANGVIVIKTKHGKPGPTRWALTGDWGSSSLNATYPESYNAWGSQPTGLSYPGSCTLALVAQRQCVQDSVSSFNPLNVGATSPFTDGHSQNYSGQVSGGSQTLQYFLGGSYGTQGGVLTFPDALKATTLAQLNGNPLPEWALHPNTFNTMQVTSTLSSQLGQQFDFALTSMAGKSDQLASPQGTGSIIAESENSLGYRDTLTQGWGPLSPVKSLLYRNSDDVSCTSGSVSANWRPTTYLSANATGGVDHTARDDESLLPNSLTIPSIAPTSSKNVSTDEGSVKNANVGATLSLPWRSLVFRTSVGGQYVDNEFSSLQASGTGLAAGEETINGATKVAASEYSSAVKTAGWYVEEAVNFQQRLFLTAALREDQSSAFGSNAKPVAYPKLNASWSVSQEPFFPRIPGLSNLRLRAAFGQAGTQPDVTARFMTYTTPITSLETGSTYVVNTIGNNSLLPERSQEVEGGFDLSLGDDRVTVEATTYNKITRDALVTVTLPPSLGVGTRVENIGQLSNRGLELSATLRPIENPMATWSTTLGYSKNTNRVDKLGTATQQNGLYGKYAEGYPVDGVWARAIVLVQDINHNGIIESSDLLLTDSTQYAGNGSPSGLFNWHNSLGLLSGRVTVSASLAYTGAMTQINGMLYNQCEFGHCRGAVDPTAPLALQALAAAAGFGPNETVWPYLERTSVLRFDEFTVSVIAPSVIARAFHAQTTTISLMGRNLGMWTHYRGADPTLNGPNSVAGAGGDQFADYGGVPQPREWSLRLHVTY